MLLQLNLEGAQQDLCAPKWGVFKSLLCAQMLGDRNWLAAKIGSGAAVDKLKLHPHGAVRMPFIYYITLGGCLRGTTVSH